MNIKFFPFLLGCLFFSLAALAQSSEKVEVNIMLEEAYVYYLKQNPDMEEGAFKDGNVTYIVFQSVEDFEKHLSERSTNNLPLQDNYILLSEKLPESEFAEVEFDASTEECKITFVDRFAE